MIEACAPVLLIGFNRPEKARLALAAIRKAAPSKLYIAVDGPRAGRADEAVRCAEVRSLASEVNWQCEVHTLFRQENLGCGLGVSEAISWFFENEEMGMIIEDDIVPHEDFFRFCTKLLLRYRHDSAVSYIAGFNELIDTYETQNSYEFARTASIWGWASWRRAWSRYEYLPSNFPNISAIFAILWGVNWSPSRAYFRMREIGGAGRGWVDTWDYQWGFSSWAQRAVIAVPSHNLISNIGFDQEATHTKGAWHRVLPQAGGMRWPLAHPTTTKRSAALDSSWLKNILPASISDLVTDVLGRTPLRRPVRIIKAALRAARRQQG